MFVHFLRNSNGSWVVSRVNGLPVGNITSDGKNFLIAKYNGLQIDLETMSAVVEFMSLMAKEKWIIENEEIDLEVDGIDIKVIKDK